MTDALHGMKDICSHYPRSESTILKLIWTEDFPATKIGGNWVSSKTMIDAWIMTKVENGPPGNGQKKRSVNKKRR